MHREYLIRTLFLLGLLLATGCGGGKSGSSESAIPHADEPVKYTGKSQPDPYYYDGRLPHAIGVHHYQVFRANRTKPSEGGSVGFTYSHQPYLAFWNGKYMLQFLSGKVQEHTPPTRIMLTTSSDGRKWADPVILFPEYSLPEITYNDITIPAGTKSVMHQRMGFYIAPNGRLLALGFYSFCPTPRFSPNKGQGIGRVVREIYGDGTFSPIYFIRYNRHAGWDESNTDYPFYKTSDDAGFIAACDSLLADKLMTLQWWEEDRGNDGFFAIDPSQVADEDPTALQAGVTTSAGAGKAFNYYRRPDKVLVGLWKNQYSALSPDEGKSWTPIVKNKSLKTCGAKTWGQQTEDGRYAIVLNHSATRRNRFPLVAMIGNDGHEFDQIFTLQGEVPPMRYQGIHKNPGPQYVRGIMEGNGNPPGDEMWLVYSMKKEDIWVCRVSVPVSGTARDHVDQDFEEIRIEADLAEWNLYLPKWAPISIAEDPTGDGTSCLELLDEDPYDYARAERIFPASRKATVSFRIRMEEVKLGNSLVVEVQDGHGTRPMKLRFEQNWLGMDREKVFPVNPYRISTGEWYAVTLQLDCDSQSYSLVVNDNLVVENLKFAQQVESLERLVIRTGPYRGDVRKWLAENGEPKTAGLYREDLPGGDAKVEPSRYLIDDVRTSSMD